MKTRCAQWAAHFLASYVTAAISCAKAERSFSGARSAIAAYTVAALIATATIGWRAYRSHLAAPAVAEDRDSPEARHRFLTFATVPVIASCDRCHGREGRGRETAAFPRLAGQKREYLLRALAAYEGGMRHSGIMELAAAGLQDDERGALADHYSRLSGLGSDEATTTRDDALARGEAIVREGIPSQGVPPCHDCHGPAPHPRNAAYPHLRVSMPSTSYCSSSCSNATNAAL